MTDERTRLMAWRPDAQGYTHDDIIIAVGMQCPVKKLAVRDVLAWLGVPDKAIGGSSAGHLVYFFHDCDQTVAMFDVVDGRVISFCTVTKSANNAVRVDEKTGQKVHFNVLDEMGTFDPLSFTCGVRSWVGE